VTKAPKDDGGGIAGAAGVVIIGAREAAETALLRLPKLLRHPWGTDQSTGTDRIMEKKTFQFTGAACL